MIRGAYLNRHAIKYETLAVKSAIIHSFQISSHFHVFLFCVFISDTSLRDGLFHEYKKFGKVMSVSIKGEKEERFAIVTFKK